MLSRVVCRRMAVARFHTAAPRMSSLQDLYTKEIKAFKPKPASSDEASASNLSFSAPSPPKAPTVEGSAAEVDSYAKEAVEVEDGASSEEQEAGDWFPV